MGFCLLRLVAAASLVSAASNSTARKVIITVDGKTVPFYRCFINSSSLRNRNLSPTNKRVRLNYKLQSSSTTKHTDVGLLNLGDFHSADEEMPDKADLPEVLRVLDVLLRRTGLLRQAARRRAFLAGLGQAREAVRRRTR